MGNLLVSVTLTSFLVNVVDALDHDGDGVSDVYAAHYGLATGSGAEDPDSDGHDNYTESAWGTDPHDSSSYFRPVSADVVGSVYDFAIPTVEGKRYQFQGSADLVSDWLNIDWPFTGTGSNEHLMTTLPIANTSKFFWRVVSAGEVDEDRDGLTAYEESLLSTSDLVGGYDSDGDLISDKNEFLHGLNPAGNIDSESDGLPEDWKQFYGLSTTSGTFDDGPNGDPDGDGLTNAQEYALGRNPVENENTPAGVPAAPENVVTLIHADGSRTYSWRDVSDNEDYFFIEIRRSDGVMVRVADNIPPNTTSYTVSAAAIGAALAE